MFTSLRLPPLAFAFAASLLSVSSMAQTLDVFAAGSLQGALTQMGAAWRQEHPGADIRFTFGASGLLKDRLLGGERADIFASANMAHPQALASAGRAADVRLFARNALCVLAPASMDMSEANLVARLLDPALRLGTSTPGADPAGDYTWQMFDRIDGLQPGAGSILKTKAMQLTGGPNSAPPPPGRNAYGELMARGAADVFVTYCTGTRTTVQEQPSLKSVAVPATVNVSAAYGITTLGGAGALAGSFIDFVMGQKGRGILSGMGFSIP